jgi:hypothetical protein
MCSNLIPCVCPKHTGLRAIRYFREIPEEEGDLHSIVVNDIDANAVEVGYCGLHRASFFFGPDVGSS